jgi:hypothetical protein
MNTATLPLNTPASADRFANRPITISRVPHDKNYTVITNHLINDPLLDWKDVGLLTFLLSKPDNWEINVSYLIKLKPTKRDGIYSGLASLENAGYLKRKPNPKGGWDYQISEVPFSQLPSMSAANPIPTPAAEPLPMPVIEPQSIAVNLPAVESMPLPAFPDTDIPLTENPIQLNTDFLPNTEKNNNTVRQPLPEIKLVLEPVVVVELKKVFSDAELPAAKKHIAAISFAEQLAVIAEMLLKVKKTNNPIPNKIGYLRGIIKNVKDGTFTPTPAAAKPISTEEMIRRDKLKRKEAEERCKVDNVAFFVDVFKKYGEQFVPEAFKQAVFEQMACCG